MSTTISLEKTSRTEKGYYLVKYYNGKRKIMFFNGRRFENFESEASVHDEIESWEKILINSH